MAAHEPPGTDSRRVPPGLSPHRPAPRRAVPTGRQPTAPGPRVRSHKIRGPKALLGPDYNRASVDPCGPMLDLPHTEAPRPERSTLRNVRLMRPFVWATSVGNGAISTGNAPLNRKTLLATGSSAKDMSGIALTGLTNNLVVRGGAALGGGSASNAAFLATAVAMQSQLAAFVDQLEGSIIVPPGGVLALLATTTPVAHSAVSGLVWEEVAL